MTVALDAPGNLVCLLGLIPLSAICLVVRRRQRVASASLGLARDLSGRALLWPLLLAGAVALIAVAAARPVVQTSRARMVRTDAEVYMVVDTSTSMLARRRRHEPARIVVARRATAAVVNALPDNVRVGVAVMPQGILPVLAPTTNRSLLHLVLGRTVNVGDVPVKPQDQLNPSAGTAATAKRARAPYVATNLIALKTLVAAPFFTRSADVRLAVLVTDGESVSFAMRSVARELERADVNLLVVRVGSPRDRLWRAIRGRVVLDPGYAPTVGAFGQVSELARSFGGDVYGPGQAPLVAARMRRLLGSGPEVVSRRALDEVALGPYLALAALILAAIPLAHALPAIPHLPTSWRRRRGLSTANPSQSLLK